MGFTVQTMLGSEALVSGTDSMGQSGKTVVSTRQWDELKAMKNFSSAEADFDKAVEEFFAPLLEAAEAAAEAVNKPKDPAEYVVLTEEVEGVEHVPAQIIELSKDSMVLRLIEEGTTDRLIWLSESELGILAV